MSDNRDHTDVDAGDRAGKPVLTKRETPGMAAVTIVEPLGGPAVDAAGNNALPRASATRREDPGTASPGLLQMPAALATRYRKCKELQTRGAEADLLLIAPLEGGGAKVLLKLYRPGIHPKPDVLKHLIEMQRAAPEHVVRLLDHGESDGRSYELMEYVDGPSLRDLLDAALPGPLPEARVRWMLEELATAIEALHKRGVWHRDLKPENVLQRSAGDLVLIDFGISSLSRSAEHMTTASRTAKYSSPEAITGVIGSGTDWWSLGVMLVEALTGRHPLDGLAVGTIDHHLATKSFDTSGVKDKRWNALCRGLLVRDPDLRWGASEVRRWLAGEDVPVAVDATFTDRGTVEDVPRADKPYFLAERDAFTASELAKLMLQNWDESVKHLSRNLVQPWLLFQLQDQSLVSFLMDLDSDESLSPDKRLLRLIYRIDPALPPAWKGVSLQRDGSIDDVAALAVQSLKDDASCAILRRLHAERVLLEFEHLRPLQTVLDDALAAFDQELEKARSDLGAKKSDLPDGATSFATVAAVALAPGGRATLCAELQARMTREPAQRASVRALISLIYRLEPRLALQWKGVALSREGLFDLACRAIHDSAAAAALWEIHDFGVLGWHPSLCVLNEDLSRAIASYETGWAAVHSAGAPRASWVDGNPVDLNASLEGALPAIVAGGLAPAGTPLSAIGLEIGLSIEAQRCAWLQPLNPGSPRPEHVPILRALAAAADAAYADDNDVVRRGLEAIKVESARNRIGPGHRAYVALQALSANVQAYKSAAADQQHAILRKIRSELERAEIRAICGTEADSGKRGDTGASAVESVRPNSREAESQAAEVQKSELTGTGKDERQGKSARPQSDAEPAHPSAANEMYMAAEAEVARQKSIWFGRTFARARVLFQEAAQLGHPRAAARLSDLPQR